MSAIFLVQTLINRKAAALASKVDQQSITQAALFPGKCVVESMVYCSHLPNLANADWL